MTSQPWL